MLIDIKNDFEILNFAFKICKVVPLRPEDHGFNPWKVSLWKPEVRLWKPSPHLAI